MKKNLAEKIADDVLCIQKTWVETVEKKRAARFKIKDWIPMLRIKEDVAPERDQSKIVFDLYSTSAKAGYEVLSGLTDYVRPEDEPWLEHYQTTAVFEILYEHDRNFKKAAVKIAEVIDKSSNLIMEEAIARFCGRYGPTWIADYVASPGSFSNLLRRIVEHVSIKPEYKWAFINAVSAARNTSYSVMFGSKFLEAFTETHDFQKAVEAEKNMMKEMWLSPAATQVQLMKEKQQESFDYEKCIRMFKDKIFDVTVAAAESKVHYVNLSLIPFWAAGDFHHVSQTTYNLCKDDIAMAILSSLTRCYENTIKKARKNRQLLNPHEIPTWEVMAAGAAYIMQLDGFTSDMINELLTKRFYNLLLSNPQQFEYECMQDEFISFLSQGEHFIKSTSHGTDAKVHGIKIDLQPICDNEVLKNPQRYSWPECPITARFSSLLKFADDPFQLYSDPMICLYGTELISLEPEKPYLPFFYCKLCPSAKLMPSRCKHCLAEKPIK